ncbi:Scr1 family TA system antitoxin-like transcriptional regulator [Streptomyces sp. NRRL F-5630]|uniref:Scr1 family TA system antitoxin-like transcriptional regulator n=1 Tax=Streptomyces sp. NRRL F-5630 TaxID=1463864 RepID=UPI003EC00145
MGHGWAARSAASKAGRERGSAARCARSAFTAVRRSSWANSAGASPCHVPFTMFTMEGKNPDIVYCESPSGGQVDYSPASVALAVEICDRLRMSALSQEASADFLRAMLKEHDS